MLRSFRISETSCQMCCHMYIQQWFQRIVIQFLRLSGRNTARKKNTRRIKWVLSTRQANIASDSSAVMKSVYSFDPLLSCCILSIKHCSEGVFGGPKRKVNSCVYSGCLLGDAPLRPMFPPIFLHHLCIFLLIVTSPRQSALVAPIAESDGHVM